MKCPTCNGHGDTGPAYSPDTCTVCQGRGGFCDYCDKPAENVSLVGTRYCSLECLCLYNVKRQSVLDYDTETDFTTLPEED